MLLVSTEQEGEAAAREAWFTSGLRLGTSAGQCLLAAFRERLDTIDAEHGKRLRARRKDAVARWEMTVETLCAGLVRVHLGDYPGGLALALANPQTTLRPSRYDPPSPPRDMLRNAVALCEAGGLVERTKGRPGALSTLRTTPLFEELLSPHGVTSDDLQEVPGSEVLWLRASAKRSEDAGEKLPYPETPATRALRSEVLDLNARLVDADLSIAEGGPKTDTSRRSLRRAFNRPDHPPATYRDFELGGRLWGGFWQSMRAYDRLRYLRIGGQPVAVVDWSSAWLRIAYAEVGAVPPEGDLYECLPGSRDGAKAATNALLASYKPLIRFPIGMREHFAPRARWEEVREAIFAAHPPIAAASGTGFSLRACRKESDALIEAMKDLQARGVVALPIHDAVAVSLPHAGVAKRVMEEMFEQVVGVTGVVAVQTYS